MSGIIDLIHPYISKLVSLVFGELISSKPIENTIFRLYYKIKDHLIFFGKKSINYEKEIWDNIQPYVMKSKLIFDIGGNIGQYALRFSNNNDIDKKVITFEPDPINVAFLQFNIQKNGIKNIEIMPFGVSYKNDNITFFQDIKTGGRSGSLIKKNKDSVPITIETKSLESIIHSFGEPDFIKIDIEGFEDELFKNFTYPLKKSTVLIEVRDSSKQAVYNYFNNLGFDCYVVDNQKIKINSYTDIPGYANLLFTKNE